MCDVYELLNRIRYIRNLLCSRAGDYSWCVTPGSFAAVKRENALKIVPCENTMKIVPYAKLCEGPMFVIAIGFSVHSCPAYLIKVFYKMVQLFRMSMFQGVLSFHVLVISAM